MSEVVVTRAEGEAAGRASAAVAVEAEADRLCASGNKTKGRALRVLAGEERGE